MVCRHSRLRRTGAAIKKLGIECWMVGLLGVLPAWSAADLYGTAAAPAVVIAPQPGAVPAPVPASAVGPAADTTSSYSPYPPAEAAARGINAGYGKAAPAAAQPAPLPAPGAAAARAAIAPPPLVASPRQNSTATAAAAVAADPSHVLQASLPALLQPSLPEETLFPHYPSLKPAVDFWTQVFAVWSENQSVLHDTEDLSKVYTVLDFRDQAAQLSPAELSSLRYHEESDARDDVRELLAQVDALQATPQSMNAAQRRIYDMFAGSSDPQRFKTAAENLRFQRGLRERTQHALAVSGRYMSQMEQIFASYDLPKLLTRLPLMESSFNLDAYSKAGAAGVWQFIPSSARIYMRLDNIVDDRRDPWFSTDAAARHLKDDYDALRDWPLALTAYNYGRGGLARALNEVDGSSLLDVIARYGNPRFGFASRNYYAEFLAATDVDRNWRQHFGDITRDAPMPFELVETRDYVRYETLRRLCGLDSQTFRTLNPSFRDGVVDGKLYVPPAHPIRVPLGTAEHFRIAYASLGSDERFDQQRRLFVNYRVARGDSAARIAQRYGISVATLLGTNGLRSASRVHAGQTLRIPSDGSELVEVAAAETHEAAHSVRVSEKFSDRAVAAAARSARAARTHRVEAGQTLGAIAKRYQTTVQLLRKFNGLRGDDVRAGTVLKIPA